VKIQARCRRKACRAIDSTGRAKVCGVCRGPLSFGIRFADAEGKLVSKTFSARKDAEVFVASRTVKISDGTWIDPALGKIALRDYFASWIAQIREDSAEAWEAGERGVLGRKTVAKYVSTFEGHVDRRLGGKPIAAVTEQAVLDVIAATRSPWTKVAVRDVVRATLNRAVREKRIAVNPAARIKVSTPERKNPVRILEPAEVEAIAGAIEPRYSALVLLTYTGALRWSEAIGLRREDVDVAGREIHVRGTLAEDQRSGAMHRQPTKTGKAITKPIDDETAKALAAHILAFPPLVSDDPAIDGLVFTGPRGGAIRKTVFERAWTPAVAAAGISEKVWPSWLRHSAITAMIHATGSTKAAAELAGHSDTRMAESHYVHYTDEAKRSNMDALAAYRASRKASG